jgi:hypothetical protein
MHPLSGPPSSVRFNCNPGQQKNSLRSAGARHFPVLLFRLRAHPVPQATCARVTMKTLADELPKRV